MEVVVENTVFNSVLVIENLMFSTFSLFRAREQQFSLVGEEMRGMTYLALPNQEKGGIDHGAGQTYLRSACYGLGI